MGTKKTEDRIVANYIHHNQCESEMSAMPDACIDVVVTDPPYGAEFMGKDWDRAMPSVDTWERMLRVMKPGAFAFVMSLPRQDLLARMIVNLEDAGFDVSFSPILWTFAVGFPKSANMGKMVDKRLGVEREVVGQSPYHSDGRSQNKGRTSLEWSKMTDAPDIRNITAPASPEAKDLHGSYTGLQMKPAYEVVLCVQKKFTDKHRRSDVYRMLGGKYDYWYTQRTVVTEPKDGRQGNIGKLTEKWKDGLEKIGYTLKDGDVIERRLALNSVYIDEVLINREHSLWWKRYSNTDITSSVTHALATGKGVTWLDSGRIPYETEDDKSEQAGKNPHTVHAHNEVYGDYSMMTADWEQPPGRFAPNLLVSDDVLDDGRVRNPPGNKIPSAIIGLDNSFVQAGIRHKYPDSGSFSRYFSLDAWAEKNLPESVKRTYPFMIVPKPSPAEKNAGLDELDDKQMYKCDNSGESLEIFGTTDGGRKPRKNTHATVKPIQLGAYLIAIGSRPGDVVFDPFCGSGSFCIAAAVTGRQYIGTDIDGEMCDIAERRIAWHVEEAKKENAQTELFGEDGETDG